MCLRLRNFPIAGQTTTIETTETSAGAVRPMLFPDHAQLLVHAQSSSANMYSNGTTVSVIAFWRCGKSTDGWGACAPLFSGLRPSGDYVCRTYATGGAASHFLKVMK